MFQDILRRSAMREGFYFDAEWGKEGYPRVGIFSWHYWLAKKRLATLKESGFDAEWGKEGYPHVGYSPDTSEAPKKRLATLKESGFDVEWGKEGYLNVGYSLIDTCATTKKSVHQARQRIWPLLGYSSVTGDLEMYE